MQIRNDFYTNIATNFHYRGESLINDINSQIKEDGKLFDKIGNNLEKAKAEYFQALSAGDQAAIAKAQDKYQTLSVAMQSALEFLNSKFQIMMSIINKLSLN